MLIINPGTEAQVDTSVENATVTAKHFAKALNLDGLRLRRNKVNDDNRGWYGFNLYYNKVKCEVDIPGINPITVMKSEPWVSPRLYVDGSSWLWGYALGCARDKLLGIE